MNDRIKIHRAPIRPTLDFHLDLGFLRLHTALWRDQYHMDSRDYVMLFFEFWGREIFRFRLYETGMSIMSRKAWNAVRDGVNSGRTHP